MIGVRSTRSPGLSEWTDDLTIQLPPARMVAHVVDFVLRSALRGTTAEEIDALLAAELGLSPDDAELARDRSFGGLVRAATRNPPNCPDAGTDPVA